MTLTKEEIKKNKVGVETGIYDNSTLDEFRNCPQYYDWRVNWEIIKPGAKRTALDFGTAIHSALEHYYKNGMTDDSIREAMEKFIEVFSPCQDINDTKRTLTKGVEIISAYCQKYRHEPFNVVATEAGGAFELGPYLYIVRIDMVVEWITPKGIYIVDNKTSSWLDRVVVKPDNQFTGYIAYANELYENVLGLIWNGIGVYDTNEIIDKDAPKVQSSKTGKMIYAKKERETLKRIPTSRTKKELSDWKEEVIHTIHQIELCQEKGVWPKYTHFCTAYHGKCPYLDLCQSQDKQIAIPLIEAGVYEKSPWVPYSELVEGGEE